MECPRVRRKHAGALRFVFSEAGAHAGPSARACRGRVGVGVDPVIMGGPGSGRRGKGLTNPERASGAGGLPMKIMKKKWKKKQTEKRKQKKNKRKPLSKSKKVCNRKKPSKGPRDLNTPNFPCF